MARRRLILGIILTVVVALGWYLLSVHRDPERALRSAARGANLVICVLDAARADHIGCYGYPRDTTPSIDRLAQQSLVFDQHFCQATFTKGSTASLFTSQYPDTHLVLRNPHPGLDESTLTMASGLKAAGFRTALFSSNPYVDPTEGIGQHFQVSCTMREAALVAQGKQRGFSPEPLLDLFTAWLGEHQESRFFAYLHFMPPHKPYRLPAEMTALFEGQQPPGYRPDRYRPGDYDLPIGDKCPTEHPELPEWINLYDSNLRYGDSVVGEVERLLKEAAVFENTIFIVTADHGEAFGEHGYVFHAAAIHDEASHIPLLIRFPRGEVAPRRFSALTQTIDLLPTLFDLFGVSHPEEQIQGRSLVPLIAGRTSKVNDYVFTRANDEKAFKRVYPEPGAPRDLRKHMIRGLDYALLLYENSEQRALYDLRADPQQRHNVIDEQPEIAEEMLAVFRSFAMRQRRPPLTFLHPGARRLGSPRAPERQLTPEMRKDLRALGYL